jgi:hypothetical protein
MAEIIIEGHKVDTKDIWDIEWNAKSRYVNVTVKITDKPDIVIGRSITYETYNSEFAGIYAPYKRLYEELNNKWQADKSELPVFKL